MIRKSGRAREKRSGYHSNLFCKEAAKKDFRSILHAGLAQNSGVSFIDKLMRQGHEGGSSFPAMFLYRRKKPEQRGARNGPAFRLASCERGAQKMKTWETEIVSQNA